MTTGLSQMIFLPFSTLVMTNMRCPHKYEMSTSVIDYSDLHPLCCPESLAVALSWIVLEQEIQY